MELEEITSRVAREGNLDPHTDVHGLLSFWLIPRFGSLTYLHDFCINTTRNTLSSGLGKGGVDGTPPEESASLFNDNFNTETKGV